MEEERDFRGVYVAAVTGGGSQVEETFLWGRRPIPWTVEAGGRSWAVLLRRKAHSMPFSLRLEKFTKEDHPGMTMARSFSSDVTKIFPDGSEEAVHIRMNEPLRDGGLVIYQASYGPQQGQPGEPYSVLAVSRNPSDRMPWIRSRSSRSGSGWRCSTDSSSSSSGSREADRADAGGGREGSQVARGGGRMIGDQPKATVACALAPPLGCSKRPVTRSRSGPAQSAGRRRRAGFAAIPVRIAVA